MGIFSSLRKLSPSHHLTKKTKDVLGGKGKAKPKGPTPVKDVKGPKGVIGRMRAQAMARKHPAGSPENPIPMSKDRGGVKEPIPMSKDPNSRMRTGGGRKPFDGESGSHDAGSPAERRMSAIAKPVKNPPRRNARVKP